MHQRSFFVIVAVAVVATSAASSAPFKCSDASWPLLDESNQTFPCSRGCPRGFDCEYQASGMTDTLGICCANATAISALYDGNFLSHVDKSSENTQHKDVPPAGNMTTGLLSTDKTIFDVINSANATVNEPDVDAFNSTQPYEDIGDEERALSCERFPYRLSCNEGRNTSRPYLRWFYDVQTLSCEFYPFGACEGEVGQPRTLRTKEECEGFCDVAKLRKAIDKLDEAPEAVQSGGEQLNSISDVTSKEKLQVPPVAMRGKFESADSVNDAKKSENELVSPADKNGKENFKGTSPANASSVDMKASSSSTLEATSTTSLPSIADVLREIHFLGQNLENIAIDDPRTESKSISQVTGEAQPFDPTIASITTATSQETSVATQETRSYESETTTEAATLSTTEGTTSETEPTLTVLDDFATLSSTVETITRVAEEIEKTDQNAVVLLNSTAEVTATGIMIEQTEEHLPTQLDSSTSSSTLAVPSTTAADVNGQQRQGSESSFEEALEKSPKSMRDEDLEFFEKQKKYVVCARTSYQLLCRSGLPTQFVYRWELIDNRCQSFPYGYCWGEQNVAHPRSKEECELYCQPSSKFDPFRLRSRV